MDHVVEYVAGAPVGVFDSGLGGLSVLRPLREMLPAEDFIYVADAAWCPYGPKPAAVVRERVFAVVEALRSRGAGLIVVACNTASTAALAAVRHRYPGLTFVGMEPAVKPAAGQTRSGAIGVLATAATAQGESLARLVDRFGRGIAVHVAVPEGLVELVETGGGDSPAAERLLAPILAAWREQDVDTIVLGCTHYPFARAAIERLAGPGVAVVDPAPAVARQAVRVLAAHGSRRPAAGDLTPGPFPLREGEPRPVADTTRDAAGAYHGMLTFLTSGEVTALRAGMARLAPAEWLAPARFGPL